MPNPLKVQPTYANPPSTLTNNQNNIVYSDINAQFSQDGNSLVLLNVAAVNNELGNLIQTVIGEVEFEPQFGSLCSYILFDNPTLVGNWTLGNRLFDAVIKWMPYIAIDLRNSLFDISYAVGVSYLRIQYYIVGLPASAAPATVDFYLTN